MNSRKRKGTLWRHFADILRCYFLWLKGVSINTCVTLERPATVLKILASTHEANGNQRHKFELTKISESTIYFKVPLSKGNLAPTTKFERSNRNIKIFFWPRHVQLTWKLNKAISQQIWIESKNENQWCFWFFTSKAFSEAMLKRNFHIGVQTAHSKFSFSAKCDIFYLAVWALKNAIGNLEIWKCEKFSTGLQID